MGRTRKLMLLCGLSFLLSCIHPVFAQDNQPNSGQITQPVEHASDTTLPVSAFPPDSRWDKISGAIQEVRFQLAPAQGREISSLHLRPAWMGDRLAVQLDFGFYYNSRLERWQWGSPDPAASPVIANFIESFTYYGKNFEINYREATDLNYGYGLVMHGYHPAAPYRTLCFSAQPWPGARLTLAEPAEIRYLAPFTPDLTASLETVRLETGLKLWGMPWQFGMTGVQEGNGELTRTGFPRQAWSLDLAYTKSAEAVPFLETAQLDQRGNGLMAGLTGRYAVVNYLAGCFRTEGRFVPNYFGGRYEDQKMNTLAGLADGLPDIASDAYLARNGWVGGVWLDMPGLIRTGLFYLDDARAGQRVLEVTLSGEIKPLKLKYGFANYGTSSDFARFDWYVKGNVGIWDYGYHHYYREAASRQVFELSVRL